MSPYMKAKAKRDFYRVHVKLQEGKCLICGLEDRLIINYDHETGDPRGLLCYAHNAGLGAFQNDPNLIEKAAAYLRAKGSTGAPSSFPSPTYKVNHHRILNLLVQNQDKSQREVSRMYAAEEGIGEVLAQARVASIAKKYGIKSKFSRLKSTTYTPSPKGN